MTTIKEASDRMLAKGSITAEEHEQLQKFAGFSFKAISDILKASIPPIQAIGMGIGMAAGGAAVTKELFIDPILSAQKVKNSYNAMKLKVPQLAGKSDSEMQDYFSVIKTFSPRAASNPLVAGALVNKMMEFGGVDHKLVQDIASIQSGAPTASAVGSLIDNGVKNLTKGYEDKREKGVKNIAEDISAANGAY